MKAVKERLLREGERGFVVKGAGYFPVLIKLRDGSLAAVLRSGAPHIGVGGRFGFRAFAGRRQNLVVAENHCLHAT